MNEWLAGPLKDFTHDILLSRQSRQRGIFNIEALSKNLESPRQYGRALWGALNIEMWFRKFM